WPRRASARKDRPPDDRTTRAPPARSRDECHPVRFRSSRDPVLGCRRKGTDLHHAACGRWATRCPVERHIKRGEFHDYESPQLLLGIRKGAILYAPLSFLKLDGGCSVGHFK